MSSSKCTVAFIGCGNMGSAILHGVLDAAFSQPASNDGLPQPKPVTDFIACTKSVSSAERLKTSLSEGHRRYVEVTSSQDVPVEIMERADVIILGFKPFMAEDVLRAAGVASALAGKLVISLLAGQTPQNLLRLIASGTSRAMPAPTIVKVIPNMGAQFRQSMTIIETPEQPVPSHMTEVVDWIFDQVGWVKYLPPGQMDLGSVLVGAALAAMTVPIEGILDGCVAEGLKRPDAMEMMLCGIRGLSAALESGIHPAVLRESISSPRGCTIQALLTLEKAGSRADYAEAIINGTRHLKQADK